MHTNERSAGLRSVAPVFSTADVGRWLEHYRSLGFEVEAHDDEYGFASLDSIDIHVSRNPDHDPLTTAGCAYIHVEDADDLYRRWSTASGGKDVEPIDTDYGIREGAHLDPDNNLLRYGSRLLSAGSSAVQTCDPVTDLHTGTPVAEPGVWPPAASTLL